MNNQTDRSNYLFYASKVSKEILLSDNEELYGLMLNNIKVDFEVKNAIKHFLQRYEISMVKFAYNYEFFLSDKREGDYSHIAPTLVELSGVPIPICYPMTFIVGFPDVVKWSRTYEADKVLQSVFGAFNYRVIVSSAQPFQNDMICKIIDSYLVSTRNALECRINNFPSIETSNSKQTPLEIIKTDYSKYFRQMLREDKLPLDLEDFIKQNREKYIYPVISAIDRNKKI